MFGGMEEMQKQMQEKLLSIEVEAQAGDGLVKIRANAARQILDISIDPSLTDTEEIEDLVLETVNRVLALAAMKEQEESSQMLSKMMPPGMGDMSSLFGQ